MAETYAGRARVATVDISQEAGKELDRKYGAGEGAMAVIVFDRDGNVVQRTPRITEAEAQEVLDRLLAAK